MDLFDLRFSRVALYRMGRLKTWNQLETERRPYGRLDYLDRARLHRLVDLQIRQEGRFAEGLSRVRVAPLPAVTELGLPLDGAPEIPALLDAERKQVDPVRGFVRQADLQVLPLGGPERTARHEPQLATRTDDRNIGPRLTGVNRAPERSSEPDQGQVEVTIFVVVPQVYEAIVPARSAPLLSNPQLLS